MPDFVGYRKMEVMDEAWQVAFPLQVLYPTTVPGKPESVGAYTLDVALDAPPKPGRFPLVLISHGTGGSALVYRTLAHHLAAHGFVVGLPEHPFNSRDDNSRANTVWNLTARPRHLQLTISFLYHDPVFKEVLKLDAVGLIGHSLGGYTALVLAGGRATAISPDMPGNPSHEIASLPDSRVKALVLLAPATPWFREPDALRSVTAPILLLEAEKDEHTTPEHGQVVLNGVADSSLVEHRVIANAGHFSFLSPFPAARISPAFPPSQDPPGFDRAAFHQKLNADVAIGSACLYRSNLR
jgi:predicted dienelactone hydrolase